jgi:hypothetical protein
MTRAISAKTILQKVMNPHTELASELLGMVKTLNTGDPTSRFQIAGVTIFLAGVDKTLSLSLQLLYLAGKIELNWIMPTAKKRAPGVVFCERGFTRKLDKLKTLGLDLEELKWLSELRNDYLHGVQIYAGYGVTVPEHGELALVLRARGPVITYGVEPLVPIGSSDLRRYGATLARTLGSLVDHAGWLNKWKILREKINCLPENPPPEYEMIRGSDIDDCGQTVALLNYRYIGPGFNRLFK